MTNQLLTVDGVQAGLSERDLALRPGWIRKKSLGEDRVLYDFNEESMAIVQDGVVVEISGQTLRAGADILLSTGDSASTVDILRTLQDFLDTESLSYSVTGGRINFANGLAIFTSADQIVLMSLFK